MARANHRLDTTHNDRGTTPRLRRRLTALAIGACATLGTPAMAQSLSKVDFNAPRSQVAAELAEVPTTQLRRVYLACAHESNRRLLEPGEAMVCTMVGDTLLARDFDGDFNALLAWWQANRDAPIAMRLR